MKVYTYYLQLQSVSTSSLQTHSFRIFSAIDMEKLNDTLDCIQWSFSMQAYNTSIRGLRIFSAPKGSKGHREKESTYTNSNNNNIHFLLFLSFLSRASDNSLLGDSCCYTPQMITGNTNNIEYLGGSYCFCQSSKYVYHSRFSEFFKLLMPPIVFISNSKQYNCFKLRECHIGNVSIV